MTRRLLGRVLLAAGLFSLPSVLPAQEHGAAAAEHGSEHHEGDPYLFWKIVNFAILAGLLGFVAVKFGGPGLRERSEEIRKSIDDARGVRKEAEARAASIESRIATLATDLEQLRETSRTEMASEELRIQEETARQAAKLEENAAQEIQQATKRAELELRDHAAKLAVELAGERVKSRLNPDTEASLVRRFVDDLGERVN